MPCLFGGAFVFMFINPIIIYFVSLTFVFKIKFCKPIIIYFVSLTFVFKIKFCKPIIKNIPDFNYNLFRQFEFLGWDFYGI